MPALHDSTTSEGLSSFSTKGDASVPTGHNPISLLGEPDDAGYPTKGDASVPTHLNTAPAPTRIGRLAPQMWWNHPGLQENDECSPVIDRVEHSIYNNASKKNQAVSAERSYLFHD